MGVPYKSLFTVKDAGSLQTLAERAVKDKSHSEIRGMLEGLSVPLEYTQQLMISFPLVSHFSIIALFVKVCGIDSP